MKQILGFLAASFILGLAASLYNCNPPSAYAIGFKINFDSTVIHDTNRIAEGIWYHPLGADSVVISWGDWIDSVGGRFAEQGKHTTTYDQINDLVIRVEQGNWQFMIYPLDTPESSSNLIWYSYSKYDINSNKVLTFNANTDYFLVMLDTTNTWDFNTGSVSQGYQYAYYLSGEKIGKNTRYWPQYFMDYYCGTKGIDSTEFIFQIDSAHAGWMYPVKCLQSFDIGLEINFQGLIENIDWTIHKR